MTRVIHVSASDSDGYTTLRLLDRVGRVDAGSLVESFDGDEKIHTLVAHGQDRIDVPAAATRVVFPDGDVWTPDEE